MARDPKGFRLSFSSTTAKKFAPTMKQATADARYWTSWGAGPVCIERRVTRNQYVKVRCLKRRKSR
jgi:hypothetical protein